MALNHQTYKYLSATWCRLTRVKVVGQCSTPQNKYCFLRKTHITKNDKPVMSEEYIVSLIVESHSTSTPELWFVVEKSRQHPGYRIT